MKSQEKFIESVNSVLSKVNYKRLDDSCNGQDKTYAKEILGQMQSAFISAYGDEMICENDVEFIELPAVIRGRTSGHVALGIVTIDIQSSGEHWGTYFLTTHGVLDQADRNLSAEEKSYIEKEFIPYDYWYTPRVAGDIHVCFEHVPEQVGELLKICEEEQTEISDNNMEINL